MVVPVLPKKHSFLKNDNQVRIAEIRILAGKGDLKGALSACNQIISTHRLEAGIYYLRASILQEMNNEHEAIRSLKQALYTDPQYVMGHFALGSIYL